MWNKGGRVETERERRRGNMEKRKGRREKNRGNEALIFARSYNALNENLRANTLAGATSNQTEKRERQKKKKKKKKREREKKK